MEDMSQKSGRRRQQPDVAPALPQEVEATVSELLQTGDVAWFDDVSISGSQVREQIQNMRSLGREWALAAWGRFYSYGEIEDEPWLAGLDTLFAQLPPEDDAFPPMLGLAAPTGAIELASRLDAQTTQSGSGASRTLPAPIARTSASAPSTASPGASDSGPPEASSDDGNAGDLAGSDGKKLDIVERQSPPGDAHASARGSAIVTGASNAASGVATVGDGGLQDGPRGGGGSRVERPRVPLVTVAVLPANRLDIEAAASVIEQKQREAKEKELIKGAGSGKEHEGEQEAKGKAAEEAASGGGGRVAKTQDTVDALPKRRIVIGDWGQGLTDDSIDVSLLDLEPGQDCRFWQDELLTSAMASGILRSHGDTIRAATQSGVAVVPRGFHLSVRRSLGAMVGAARRHMELSRGGADGLLRAAMGEAGGESGTQGGGGGKGSPAEGAEEQQHEGSLHGFARLPPVQNRSSDWLEHVFRRDGNTLGLLGGPRKADGTQGSSGSGTSGGPGGDGTGQAGTGTESHRAGGALGGGGSGAGPKRKNRGKRNRGKKGKAKSGGGGGKAGSGGADSTRPAPAAQAEPPPISPQKVRDLLLRLLLDYDRSQQVPVWVPRLLATKIHAQLVRTSVQAAVDKYAPELGGRASSSDEDEDENEGASSGDGGVEHQSAAEGPSLEAIEDSSADQSQSAAGEALQLALSAPAGAAGGAGIDTASETDTPLAVTQLAVAAPNSGPEISALQETAVSGLATTAQPQPERSVTPAHVVLETMEGAAIEALGASRGQLQELGVLGGIHTSMRVGGIPTWEEVARHVIPGDDEEGQRRLGMAVDAAKSVAEGYDINECTPSLRRVKPRPPTQEDAFTLRHEPDALLPYSRASPFSATVGLFGTPNSLKPCPLNPRITTCLMMLLSASSQTGVTRVTRDSLMYSTDDACSETDAATGIGARTIPLVSRGAMRLLMEMDSQGSMTGPSVGVELRKVAARAGFNTTNDPAAAATAMVASAIMGLDEIAIRTARGEAVDPETGKATAGAGADTTALVPAGDSSGGTVAAQCEDSPQSEPLLETARVLVPVDALMSVLDLGGQRQDAQEHRLRSLPGYKPDAGANGGMPFRQTAVAALSAAGGIAVPLDQLQGTARVPWFDNGPLWHDLPRLDVVAKVWQSVQQWKQGHNMRREDWRTLEATKQGLLRLELLRDKFEVVDREHARLVGDQDGGRGAAGGGGGPTEGSPAAATQSVALGEPGTLRHAILSKLSTEPSSRLDQIDEARSHLFAAVVESAARVFSAQFALCERMVERKGDAAAAEWQMLRAAIHGPGVTKEQDDYVEEVIEGESQMLDGWSQGEREHAAAESAHRSALDALMKVRDLRRQSTVLMEAQAKADEKARQGAGAGGDAKEEVVPKDADAADRDGVVNKEAPRSSDKLAEDKVEKDAATARQKEREGMEVLAEQDEEAFLDAEMKLYHLQWRRILWRSRCSVEQCVFAARLLDKEELEAAHSLNRAFGFGILRDSMRLLVDKLKELETREDGYMESMSRQRRKGRRQGGGAGITDAAAEKGTDGRVLAIEDAAKVGDGSSSQDGAGAADSAGANSKDSKGGSAVEKANCPVAGRDTTDEGTGDGGGDAGEQGYDSEDEDMPDIADIRVCSKMGDGLYGMVEDVEWRLKEQVRFGLAAGIGVVRLLAASAAVSSMVAARRRRQAHDRLVKLAAAEVEESQRAAEHKARRKQEQAAAKRARAEAKLSRKRAAKLAKEEEERKRAEERRVEAERKAKAAQIERKRAEEAEDRRAKEEMEAAERAAAAAVKQKQQQQQQQQQKQKRSAKLKKGKLSEQTDTDPGTTASSASSKAPVGKTQSKAVPIRPNRTGTSSAGKALRQLESTQVLRSSHDSVPAQASESRSGTNTREKGRTLGVKSAIARGPHASSEGSPAGQEGRRAVVTASVSPLQQASKEGGKKMADSLGGRDTSGKVGSREVSLEKVQIDGRVTPDLAEASQARGEMPATPLRAKVGGAGGKGTSGKSKPKQAAMPPDSPLLQAPPHGRKARTQAAGAASTSSGGARAGKAGRDAGGPKILTFAQIKQMRDSGNASLKADSKTARSDAKPNPVSSRKPAQSSARPGAAGGAKSSADASADSKATVSETSSKARRESAKAKSRGKTRDAAPSRESGSKATAARDAASARKAAQTVAVPARRQQQSVATSAKPPPVPFSEIRKRISPVDSRKDALSKRDTESAAASGNTDGPATAVRSDRAERRGVGASQSAAKVSKQLQTPSQSSSRPVSQHNSPPRQLAGPDALLGETSPMQVRAAGVPGGISGGGYGAGDEGKARWLSGGGFAPTQGTSAGEGASGWRVGQAAGLRTVSPMDPGLPRAAVGVDSRFHGGTQAGPVAADIGTDGASSIGKELFDLLDSADLVGGGAGPRSTAVAATGPGSVASDVGSGSVVSGSGGMPAGRSPLMQPMQPQGGVAFMRGQPGPYGQQAMYLGPTHAQQHAFPHPGPPVAQQHPMHGHYVHPSHGPSAGPMGPLQRMHPGKGLAGGGPGSTHPQSSQSSVAGHAGGSTAPGFGGGGHSLPHSVNLSPAGHPLDGGDDVFDGDDFPEGLLDSVRGLVDEPKRAPGGVVAGAAGLGGGSSAPAGPRGYAAGSGAFVPGAAVGGSWGGASASGAPVVAGQGGGASGPMWSEMSPMQTGPSRAGYGPPAAATGASQGAIGAGFRASAPPQGHSGGILGQGPGPGTGWGGGGGGGIMDRHSGRMGHPGPSIPRRDGASAHGYFQHPTSMPMMGGTGSMHPGAVGLGNGRPATASGHSVQRAGQVYQPQVQHHAMHAAPTSGRPPAGPYAQPPSVPPFGFVPGAFGGVGNGSAARAVPGGVPPSGWQQQSAGFSHTLQDGASGGGGFGF